MPRRTQWRLFLDRHKPKLNHLEPNAACDGFMFETFGDEWQFVKSQPVNHVFTITEGDNGKNWYAGPGFHIVNRIGYFVTEIPWTSENESKIYKV